MIQAQLPVYWYSGLYLQPQHFQSMDLHQSWQHAQHWRHGKPAIVKAIATACRVSQSGAREIDELIDEHVLPELARVVAAEQGKTGVLTLSFSKNRYQCQWKNLSAVEA